jgi:hypothetical protein
VHPPGQRRAAPTRTDSESDSVVTHQYEYTYKPDSDRGPLAALPPPPLLATCGGGTRTAAPRAFPPTVTGQGSARRRDSDSEMAAKPTHAACAASRQQIPLPAARRLLASSSGVGLAEASDRQALNLNLRPPGVRPEQEMKLVMCVDVGTSSVKACVISSEGFIITSASTDYKTTFKDVNEVLAIRSNSLQFPILKLSFSYRLNRTLKTGGMHLLLQ